MIMKRIKGDRPHDDGSMHRDHVLRQTIPQQFPNRREANHSKAQDRSRSLALSWSSNVPIGLKKDTKMSHLGALAFPGTLRGIAQGTLLDFQQISPPPAPY